ncbi:MAG: PQQ-like beta-propeller repeat protein [Planctomycetia bacterium]|nr:PQQ-like beta-propeller repeat protein [Planctomycetia bacterium]
MRRALVLCALAAVALRADPEPAASWPCFRGGEARVGSDGSEVPGKVAVLWKARNERDRARVMGSPAVAGGRVYVGADNDTLFCYDAEKGGAPAWEFGARYEVFSSPAVADGRVYVGEGLHVHEDARLYCLDAATGRKLWEFRTTGHVESSPAVSGGLVFFGAGGDGLYALDAATGAKKWQVKGLHVDSAPLVTGGLVIVGSGYGETAIGAWKAESGEQAWRTKVPASAWGAPAAGPKGIVVGIGNGNFGETLPNAKAELLCLSPADGSVVWRTPLKNAAMAAAAVANGNVYLGNRGGEFGCFEGATGKKLWEAGCGRAVVSSAAVSPNAVVWGCDGGHLHAADPGTGKVLWNLPLGHDGVSSDLRIVSSPAISGGRIFVGSNNNWFYCVGEKK